MTSEEYAARAPQHRAARRDRYAAQLAAQICTRCRAHSSSPLCPPCRPIERARIRDVARRRRSANPVAAIQQQRDYRLARRIGFRSYAAFVEWDRREELLAISELSALHHVGVQCE